MNSAPNLLQKRLTQDLLDPWSRAWSTGPVRRLRLSREGLELRHLQELKWGVLSTEDSPHHWVVAVEMGLGGQLTFSVLLSALDTYVVTLMGDSERAFFFLCVCVW